MTTGRGLPRVVDVLLALVALVMLSPVLLILSFAILATQGRPIVFRQQRPGLRGRPFVFYKFRTMTDERGPDGARLPDEHRITRIGAFLRKTTLDELPALVNVLKGEMAIVGPRPLLMKYLGRYSLEQARRHDVKPGLTGWAVVNGRNSLSWDDKFALDVWYLDHRSVSLDLKIIWKTIVLVLTRKGVSATGHATMPEFEGRKT